MGDAAVVFDRVWKKFRRGERHDSLRDLLPWLARKAVGRHAPDLADAAEFWALENVSFEVAPGTALGIIGPNGAGKSTILKLLTRILKPTRGVARVRGRFGALIEVAAGFHPDLTGRENIFLQGAIMGMKRTEIAAQLDAIIEFAGVEEFVDTPVKRYSSGMNARLGFSIAAHLNPDVLVIDEVLSVGDMAFQERCVARMHEFKRAGVAIVFVSHNLQAVATLCDQALYLKHVTVAIGPPEDVLRAYVRGQHWATPAGHVVEMTASSLTQGEAAAGTVRPGDRLGLTVTLNATQSVADLTFGFLVYRSTDRLLAYDANVTGGAIGLHTLEPGSRTAVRFDFTCHLTRGQYHVVCHVFHNPTQRFVGVLEPAALFTVSEGRSYAGIADLGVQATKVGSNDSGAAVPLAVAARGH